MIKGFRGTSLVDYPEKIASVIYTYGCNFRCPYCYNIELVLPEFYRELPSLSEGEIIAKLKERENFIQGVVITGGEPTIWGKRLLNFLEELKTHLNYPIKIDTNGSKPDIIGVLLAEDLVDYVALDFKTTPDKYEGLGGDFSKVEETLKLLSAYPDKVEIRITLYPPLVGLEDIKSLVPYLKPFSSIALQKYLPEKNLSGRVCQPYTDEEYLQIYHELTEHLPSANIIRRF